MGPHRLRVVEGGVPHTAAFIARFLQRLRLARGSFAPFGWLEQWIAEDGMTGEEAASLSSQRQAITQIVMANSITSLRSIARMDWRLFVERQSVTDAVLRRDPSSHYPRMTFATRDHYRHVVERIAARTHREEPAVASAAIELASHEPPEAGGPGDDPDDWHQRDQGERGAGGGVRGAGRDQPVDGGAPAQLRPCEVV
jgi:cyclic beta-1,2-glucan synthetase